MQIKPVTKANKPEYPTASEIDIPKVLNASKPNKWKRNAAIGAVMVGMVLSANSCRIFHSSKRESYPLDSIALIAPLFEHGDGSGAFGCIVVAPPIFLSESQMFDIVESELEDLGINYKKNYDDSLYVTVRCHRLKKEFRSFSSDSHEGYNDTLVTKQLPYDFVIDSTNMGIIISTESKYEDFGNQDLSSSVEVIALKRLASDIIRFNNHEKSFVCFYDPVEDGLERDTYNKVYRIPKSTIKQKSKEKFREQVRDFVKWFEANKHKKMGMK